MSNRAGDTQKPENHTHSSIKIPKKLSHAACIDPGDDKALYCGINEPHAFVFEW